MFTKKNLAVISILVLISAAIYGMQIYLYNDVRDTGFYIMQDMAFIPISIAITTVVIGEILDINNKRDSRRKTRMLTSTFFSDIGFELMSMIASVSNIDSQTINKINSDDLSDAEKIEIIKAADFKISMEPGIFAAIGELIRSSKTDLLILSSNPMLYDHECFSDLLWDLFHLLDEYRLRGDFSRLTAEDIEHFNEDFEQIFDLLLINWVANANYLRKTYPHFYKVVSSFLDS